MKAMCKNGLGCLLLVTTAALAHQDADESESLRISRSGWKPVIPEPILPHFGEPHFHPLPLPEFGPFKCWQLNKGFVSAPTTEEVVVLEEARDRISSRPIEISIPSIPELVNESGLEAAQINRAALRPMVAEMEYRFVELADLERNEWKVDRSLGFYVELISKLQTITSIIEQDVPWPTRKDYSRIGEGGAVSPSDDPLDAPTYSIQAFSFYPEYKTIVEASGGYLDPTFPVFDEFKLPELDGIRLERPGSAASPGGKLYEAADVGSTTQLCPAGEGALSPFLVKYGDSRPSPAVPETLRAVRALQRTAIAYLETAPSARLGAFDSFVNRKEQLEQTLAYEARVQNTIAETFRAAAADIDAEETRLVERRQELEDMNAELKSLRDDLAGHKEQQAVLEDELSRIATKLEKLPDEIRQQKETLHSFGDSCEAFHGRSCTLDEEINWNEQSYAAEDRLQDLYDHEIDLLDRRLQVEQQLFALDEELQDQSFIISQKFADAAVLSEAIRRVDRSWRKRRDQHQLDQEILANLKEGLAEDMATVASWNVD